MVGTARSQTCDRDPCADLGGTVRYMGSAALSSKMRCRNFMHKMVTSSMVKMIASLPNLITVDLARGIFEAYASSPEFAFPFFLLVRS